MKSMALITLFTLSLGALAEDTQLFRGTFKPMANGIRVQGEAEIYRTPEGQDYVKVENFKLRGGVVLDLKVCGMADTQQNVCLSIGEPRLTRQSWTIPRLFQSYEKVLIFDLDLIQNLAGAQNKMP